METSILYKRDYYRYTHTSRYMNRVVQGRPITFKEATLVSKRRDLSTCFFMSVHACAPAWYLVLCTLGYQSKIRIVCVRTPDYLLQPEFMRSCCLFRVYRTKRVCRRNDFTRKLMLPEELVRGAPSDDAIQPQVVPNGLLRIRWTSTHRVNLIRYTGSTWLDGKS